MSSDITQTPTHLFQNMLLQHVWFYLLKLAKHSSLSPKKWSTKPNRIYPNHVKISLLSIPKRHRERGEKYKLQAWTNGLAVLQLGMQKRISASPYKTHLFAVYSYQILSSHPHTELIYFFIFCTNM